MEKYQIKEYQKGVERDQVRIGREVAQHWVWPYAYNLEDLLALHAQPGFERYVENLDKISAHVVAYPFIEYSAEEFAELRRPDRPLRDLSGFPR